MSVFYEKKTRNWWFILGFICPIAGLILFFTLKEKNAKAAQKSGIGALCMVIACAFVLLIILLYKLNLDPVFHQVPGIF